MTPGRDERVLCENARVAAGLARSLCAGGRLVVCSPGSRSTPLALAFDALAPGGVQVVLDERAAGFFALGVARASGEPAVCVCTSGSAAAHYYPAVVEANLGRAPLLLVTADRPAEHHDCGAPQAMPQRALFGAHVRLALSLPEPCEELSDGWLRNTAARALAAACATPPGPVHINVPFREPLYRAGGSADGLAGEREGAAPHCPGTARLPAKVTRGTLRLGPAQVQELASELALEPRGVLVCGPLAPASLPAQRLAFAVARLGTALGWPVIADPLSGLRFGAHERSQVVAAADVLLQEEQLATVLRASRVMQFGQRPTSKSVCRWLEQHPDALTLVDADGLWLDGGGVAERLIAADPPALCEDLAVVLESMNNRQDPAFSGRWLAADAAARASLAHDVARGQWQGRVVGSLIDALPDGALLHVASSMPVRDLDVFGGLSRKRIRVTSNRGVNGIDGTVATALGASLAWPGPGPVAALMGDLALLHDLDGLEAASALLRNRPRGGLRLTLVVIHNGGGGIFGELPIAHHPTAFERLFLTPRAADIAGICRALGLGHERLEAGALGAVLPGALERPGVNVLEVPAERQHNSAARRAAIERAAAAARRAIA